MLFSGESRSSTPRPKSRRWGTSFTVWIQAKVEVPITPSHAPVGVDPTYRAWGAFSLAVPRSRSPERPISRSSPTCKVVSLTQASLIWEWSRRNFYRKGAADVYFVQVTRRGDLFTFCYWYSSFSSSWHCLRCLPRYLT